MPATELPPISDQLAAVGTIDHQVTYRATPELHDVLRDAVKRVISVKRVLESTYFDGEGLPLYRSGAMMRERGRRGRSGRSVEAKIPTQDGVLRLKGDAAVTAAAEIASQRQLCPVATQTKHRQLLLVAGSQSGFAPDFVIALDHALITGVGHKQEQQRCEIELQLFTALPWTSRVNNARVQRFSEFCRACEAEFDLTKADRTGYQAISKEMLR